MSIYFWVHVELQIQQAEPHEVAQRAVLHRSSPLQLKTEFLGWKLVLLAVFMWL